MAFKSGNKGNRELDTTFVIPRKASTDGPPNKYVTNTVLAEAYEKDVKNEYHKISYQAPNSQTPSIYVHQMPISWANFYEKASTNANSSNTNWIQKTQRKRTWADTNSTDDNSTVPILRYKHTFGDLFDETLPKELLMQFQPLFCKLCMIQLTGRSMAKLHYMSKNHDKKVRAWLIEYSEQTGQPLHKRAVVPRAQKGEEYNPKHYHCDVCDLALTGKIHAESHYMGKAHQRVLHKMGNPSGKGFHDNEDKWVRTVAAKDDSTGRDGFGQAFAKKEKSGSMLTCDLCDVTVTSQGQMEMHTQGWKHKRKLKQSEADEFAGESEFGEEEAPDLNVVDDLSSYRTPSGQFYCEICNLSLNSKMQFMQHLNSRKHAKRSTQPGPAHTEVSLTGAPTSADDLFMHL